MGNIEVEEIDELSANAEIRVLALELMKIALKKNKSFFEVTKEYIKNVYLLKEMLNKEKE